jgi:hypothetical protein
MSSILTSQPNLLTASPMQRLAERWRPVGIHLASLARDGSILWQDAEMPRVMSLCLTDNRMLISHLQSLSDALTTADVTAISVVPGIEIHLAPVMRRRKVVSWIAALMRTEIIGMSEELQRLASRGRVDALWAAQQVQRLPRIDPAVAPAIAGLIGQMHDDLSAAGSPA